MVRHEDMEMTVMKEKFLTVLKKLDTMQGHTGRLQGYLGGRKRDRKVWAKAIVVFMGRND